MTTTSLLRRGSTGIAIDLAPGGSHLDTAAELESLGYDTLWIAGGQLDRLDRVDELVAATSAVQVATGIVPLGVYAPADVAEQWHRLTATAPGRFVLGLGGPQVPRALPALRAALDELDAAGVPTEERLLAALGPRKTEIARDRAAGAITLLVTPESTARTRDRLGARSTLAVHQLVAVGTDAEQGRAAARRTLSFLAGVPGYRASFERMGFGADEIDELGDRLVDALVVIGDDRDVLDRVRAHRTAGADHVNLSVLPAEGGPGVVETARALASSTAVR